MAIVARASRVLNRACARGAAASAGVRWGASPVVGLPGFLPVAPASVLFASDAVRGMLVSKRQKDTILANDRLVRALKPHTRVLLVSDEGRVGEMSAAKAMERARQDKSDLVAVAMQASPPVVKLTSLGRIKRANDKKAAQQRAAQRATKLKEMRFSCKIEANDLEIKTNNVIKFLKKGHPVKVSVSFVPRTPVVMLEPLRRAVMRRVLEQIGNIGYMEPSALRVSFRELYGLVLPAPSQMAADDDRHLHVLPKLESPIWPSSDQEAEAIAERKRTAERVEAKRAKAAADMAEDFGELAPKGAPRGLADASGLRDEGRRRKDGPQRRRPKGSPTLSREDQEEWRSGMSVAADDEAEADEMMDLRESDSWLRGSKGRRPPTKAPAKTGRMNSGDVTIR